MYDPTMHCLYITTSFFQILKFDTHQSKMTVLAGRDRPDLSTKELADVPLSITDASFDDVLFWDLRGITLDQHGDLYLLDKRYIRKLHMKEQTVQTICDEDGAFHILKSLATNEIFSSSPFVSGNGVFKINLGTHTSARVSQEGAIDNPRGLLMTTDGSLLVCNDKGLCKVDLKSQYPIVPTPVWKEPMCRVIVADDQGNLFVGTNDRIIQLDFSQLSA